MEVKNKADILAHKIQKDSIKNDIATNMVKIATNQGDIATNKVAIDILSASIGRPSGKKLRQSNAEITM